MNFIKRNIYVIAGAFFVVIICVLYFMQNDPPDDIIAGTVSGERKVLYDSTSDTAVSSAVTPVVTPAPSVIAVYISGEVVSPGVYEVSPGARVEQAVEMAGGLTEQADPDRINLAAYMSDAQHINVPAIGDPVTAGEASAAGVPSGDLVPSGASSELNAVININTATSEELQTLPGIGEAIAGYIIEYREENGGFKSIDEIMNVMRIGAVTFDKIKDRITV
jgi:competence protein ComEA